MTACMNRKIQTLRRALQTYVYVRDGHCAARAYFIEINYEMVLQILQKLQGADLYEYVCTILQDLISSPNKIYNNWLISFLRDSWNSVR